MRLAPDLRPSCKSNAIDSFIQSQLKVGISTNSQTGLFDGST